MLNKIHYSPDSLADLDMIYEYINDILKNPIAAKNTIDGILESISDLKTLDKIGVKVILADGFETEYRFIQYNNYLTFYRAKGSEVFIDRIMHKNRNYLTILFGE